MHMKQEPGGYWSDLPCLLPGRYKTRKGLGGRYVLQVSGNTSGKRHLAKLLKITPWGAFRTAWFKIFAIGQEDGGPRQRALRLLIADWDKRPGNGLPESKMLETAKAVLSDFEKEENGGIEK